MNKKTNISKYLVRKDKWYLGGGDKLLWAPPFPQWLDYPGCWDRIQYYNMAIETGYTWTILDKESKEIKLNFKDRTWYPSKLISEFATDGLEITESRAMLRNDVLASEIMIRNKTNSVKNLSFILWTVHDHKVKSGSGWLSNVKVNDGIISFTKNVNDSKRPLTKFGCALGISKKAKSTTINSSQGGNLQPHYKFTPFPEKFINGSLPNEIKVKGMEDGVIYLGIHTELIIKPNSTQKINAGFSAGTNSKTAVEQLKNSIKKDIVKDSDENWQKIFNGVPYFECSDDYIDRYYWYRWYGLRLFTIYGGEGNYKYPAVCEGLGNFRAPITYSAMCHMLETRWMKNPEVAEGSLLNFISNQREDGGFRGYIDFNVYRQEFFYHGNWGNSVNEVYNVFNDKKYLEKIYPGLKKYADYFDKQRDKENSGLYDIENHYETGQEYMHRYIAVSKDADKDHWGDVFRLKGVDVTIYIYELKKVLARIAGILGKSKKEENNWISGTEKTKHAVLNEMWDKRDEMFYDINPFTKKRTKVKAAVCFYPYFTDIVDDSHLPGLKKHLLNPNEFWTEWPVASSSIDDKYYSSDAEWKEQRMNCPWNGRVWPMTNSHIAEALAVSAIRFNDEELFSKSVEFMNKFIRMMFYDQDPNRPNCYEHYNPNNAIPSIYRGVDDYQHSWVVDLIMKYVGGIQPKENSIVINPFPFEMNHFVLDEIFIRGRKIKVERKNKSFTVTVDSKEKHVSKIGKQIIINL
ncbi:MAG: hypothetical protein K9J16_08375 [Melioribacteraceae bacterium]|nr:hypothetical protein [Melioribacteraceae bacterium]MCF8353160.1 hypothetical protein [Melioribacteraceae bacterium]MCF8393140.1 hypothetical protein [Melioribacteraceae bacterium]MCF8418043.1 hypothetical protein [Melioribacteraceae bacterium]